MNDTPKALLTATEIAAFTPEKKEIYDQDMKNEHDFEYEKSICYREGLKEGRAEGLEERRLKGLKKGVPRVLPQALPKKRCLMRETFWRKAYRRRLLQDASDFRSRR